MYNLNSPTQTLDFRFARSPTYPTTLINSLLLVSSPRFLSSAAFSPPPRGVRFQPQRVSKRLLDTRNFLRYEREEVSPPATNKWTICAAAPASAPARELNWARTMRTPNLRRTLLHKVCRNDWRNSQPDKLEISPIFFRTPRSRTNILANFFCQQKL